MPFCPAGQSPQPKPGVISKNIISGALIFEGLTAISPWLAIAAAFIDAFIYDSTAQCTADPPGWPTFSQSDILSLPGGIANPGFLPLIAKAKQQLMQYLWGQFCQCTGGTTPSLGSPPAVPDGTGVGVGSQAFACGSGQGTHTFVNQNSFISSDAENISLGNIPMGTGTITGTMGDGGHLTAYAIPPGITGVSWVGTTAGTTQTPNNQCGFLQISGFNNAGTNITNAVFTGNLSGTGLQTSGFFSFLNNPTYWTLWWNVQCILSPSNLVNGVVTDQLQFWCGGSPSGLCTPCTSPPGNIELIQEIWNEVQVIYNSLPQAVHSYAEGAVHSGLTGSGTISLNNAIAVKVAITTDNPLLRVAPGNPPFLFDRGFIVNIGVEGAVRSTPRIVYNPQVFQLAPATTQIGYATGQLVTISITELTRAS